MMNLLQRVTETGYGERPRTLSGLGAQCQLSEGADSGQLGGGAMADGKWQMANAGRGFARGSCGSQTESER